MYTPCQLCHSRVVLFERGSLPSKRQLFALRPRLAGRPATLGCRQVRRWLGVFTLQPVHPKDPGLLGCPRKLGSMVRISG